MSDGKSQIVFSSSAGGDEDLYLMNEDGSGFQRLTQIRKEGETNRTPEWSPDKTEIAFQSNRDGVRSIYILSVESGELRRLTQTMHDCAHPAWSADGKRLAFTSVRDQVSALYLINRDGSGESVVPIKGFENRNIFNPCLIPGGREIAFVLQGENGGPDSLWKIGLGKDTPYPVGPEDLGLFEFDYSPDGEWLVFDRKISTHSPLGDWDIFSMRADGSDLKRLTKSTAMSSRPKFMSNGRIVFHTNRFGSRIEQPAADATLDEWFSWWNEFEVCTMKADGSDVRRLTMNKLKDLHPDG